MEYFEESGILQAVRASEIFSNIVSQFQRACVLYKSMLDGNLGRKFCIGDHCAAVYMVEILLESKWGATPKMFSTKEEAEKEAEALKKKYSFISETRIITRNVTEGESK